jgi:hypothetical protein
LLIAICLVGAHGATAQSLSDEIWSVHCLSASEQQRIATQFTDALKPYGLNEPDKVGLRVQTLMSEAITTRTKADQCSEAAGDAAPQRCKAQEAAADEAEKRMEKFGESMEKLEKDLMVIRARYRKC